MASVEALHDRKSIRHGVLDERHVRNEAHGSMGTDHVLKDLQHRFKRAALAVRIETSETLVDEDRIEANATVRRFDNVGKPER